MIDHDEQQEIGREIVAKLGALPGYGPIVWWDNKNDEPIDGATRQWGIDIRTINRNDPVHEYRYMDLKRGYPHTTLKKAHFARKMGLTGIVGILIILDYRYDTAEIYGKNMPLTSDWFNQALNHGIYGWHKYDAPRLIENVRFKNPYKDHKSVAHPIDTTSRA